MRQREPNRERAVSPVGCPLRSSTRLFGGTSWTFCCLAHKPGQRRLIALLLLSQHILRNVRIFRHNSHVMAKSASSRAPNALLSFTVRNVRSYRDEATLSLLGTRLSDAEVVRELTIAGSTSPVSVLPSAGIFGANASGKSTILRAMADMRLFVLHSFRRADQETRLPRNSFLLRGKSAECPSSFAIDLILDGVRWQYGFEISDHEVLDEYAYHYPRGRQALVFRRTGDDREPSFGPAFRSSGRTLAGLVRKSALLLSVAGAAADGSGDRRPGIVTLIGPLFNWFRRNLGLMESENRDNRITYTAKRLEVPRAEAPIVALLQAADLGITRIERLPIDPEVAERMERAFRILNGLEEETKPGQEVRFLPNDLVRLHHMGAEGPVPVEPEHESQGTLAWIGMLGPMLDSIRRGSVLLMDELDGSLHPHLVQRFVQLFQSRKTNPWCAQLIFNAHDPTILGDSFQRPLGRDQIWFTEKDPAGATTLYSMAEFGPKGTDALGRRYLQGRYGAVPVLNPGEFEQAADVAGS